LGREDGGRKGRRGEGKLKERELRERDCGLELQGFDAFKEELKNTRSSSWKGSERWRRVKSEVATFLSR